MIVVIFLNSLILDLYYMKVLLISVSKDDVWPLECLLRCGAEELSIPLEIEYDTDIDLILKYRGAKSIPFLVYDQEIFFDGGLPTKDMVLKFFKAHFNVSAE